MPLSSYVAPEVAADLKLDQHGGLEVVSDRGAFVASPQPNGRCLQDLSATRARTATDIAQFSKVPTQLKYPEFVNYLSGLAKLVRGLMRMTPRRICRMRPSHDLRSVFGIAKPLRARLAGKQLVEFARFLPMTAADMLDEWFESPELKGALAANGVRSYELGDLRRPGRRICSCIDGQPPETCHAQVTSSEVASGSLTEAHRGSSAGRRGARSAPGWRLRARRSGSRSR